MRVKHEINLTDIHSIKEQLLQWADSFEQVVWLDSNAYPNNDNKYEAVLAVESQIKTGFSDIYLSMLGGL